MQINSHKNLKITERILIYLDSKGITKYKFHKDLGFSNGFLDTKREIGTDKYAKILEYLKDVDDNINPDWLLTGTGEMLKASAGAKNNVKGNHIGGSVGNVNIGNGSLTIQGKEYQKEVENLRVQLQAKDEIIKTKDELLKMKDEIIEMLRANK